MVPRRVVAWHKVALMDRRSEELEQENAAAEEEKYDVEDKRHLTNKVVSTLPRKPRMEKQHEQDRQ